MKNHLEIVFFGTLCYKNEAFVLFPKHKFLIFLGCLMNEIYQIMYFLHQCFWSLPLQKDNFNTSIFTTLSDN